jgi:hypothetical protein
MISKYVNLAITRREIGGVMVIRVSDPPMDKDEKEAFLFVLRAQGKVLETSDENEPVPARYTHILLIKEGEEPELRRVRF